jgi:hypothetical protein
LSSPHLYYSIFRVVLNNATFLYVCVWNEGERKEMYSLSTGLDEQLLAVGSDSRIYLWFLPHYFDSYVINVLSS